MTQPTEVIVDSGVDIRGGGLTHCQECNFHDELKKFAQRIKKHYPIFISSIEYNRRYMLIISM